MDRNNRKDRNTLKAYFRKGEIPTEGQFAELIDSMTNLVEDGQIIRTATGWVFYPKQNGSLDISLYTEEVVAEAQLPVWLISVTPEKKLVIKNEQGDTVIEVGQDKSVVLYGDLTVDGKELIIPADKHWHNLPLETYSEGSGVCVYRIYASFCERGTGLCQLTRITAIWLNFMEQQIESGEKHWWGWSGGVRFRWQEVNGKPCLQMRTKKRLPSGEVHCMIVEEYKG